MKSQTATAQTLKTKIVTVETMKIVISQRVKTTNDNTNNQGKQ